MPTWLQGSCSFLRNMFQDFEKFMVYTEVTGSKGNVFTNCKDSCYNNQRRYSFYGDYRWNFIIPEIYQLMLLNMRHDAPSEHMSIGNDTNTRCSCTVETQMIV